MCVKYAHRNTAVRTVDQAAMKMAFQNCSKEKAMSVKKITTKTVVFKYF